VTERERAVAQPSGAELLDRQVKRWRAEFPYHWDADDLVSRRRLLAFTVFNSGALFAATALLAVLGAVRDRTAFAAVPVARAAEVAEGQALYFRYPRPDDEAVLLHLPGRRFVAYSQTCTHLSCSVFYQADRRRLYCPCHEGVFDPASGDPVAGPPQRPLPRILLREEGGVLYAVGREP
jgi:nitrite reductase/ring-hydroxylating ferredoxin subunit